MQENMESFMLGGRVLSFDVFAYAQPLLWLRYGGLGVPDAVLVVAGDPAALRIVFRGGQ